jgi:hypothetical protein
MAFKAAAGISISSDTTLNTSTHSQHWINVTATCVVTLPALASGTTGKTVYALVADADFTLAGAGAETIAVPGSGAAATSITVHTGQTIVVVNNASVWTVVSNAWTLNPAAYAAETTFDPAADYLLAWDASASRLRKFLLSSMLAGYHTVWVPAGAVKPRVSSGAGSVTIETTTNKVNFSVLDFDPSANEYAQFSVRMPKSWNETDLDAAFLWTVAGGTGNVVWGIQALALGDDAATDAAFGAAQKVTDGVTATGDLMVSATTGNIATGAAENDLVVMQVYRDAADGNDTLSANDARLLGVLLRYKVAAVSDT